VSVARHTAYNLAGSAASIVVTLITVPLYLKLIGLERFGVLSLCWVFAGYFAFFDFGIGRATAQKMATLADKPPEQRNRLFWTSAALSAALAVVGGLLFWPLAALALRWMEATPQLVAEARSALWLLVMVVPLAIIQSFLSGTLDGRRAFGPVNVAGVIGNALTAILPLLSAFVFEPRIDLLVAATLVARLLFVLALFLLCVRIVPVRRPVTMATDQASALLKFGGWVTVTSIVGPVLIYFDRLAIGAWLGAAAVAFYVIGFNLVMQLQVVPISLGRALFPKLAELGEANSKERSEDAAKALSSMVTPLAVLAIVAVDPFLRIWLGADVAEVSAPVTRILLVGFWANALAQIPFVQIQARAQPGISARIHLLEILPYVATLYIGISYFGLLGAALAWSLRCLADLILLSRKTSVLDVVLRQLATNGLLVAVAATVMSMPLTIPMALLVAVALLAVSAALSWQTIPLRLRTETLGSLSKMLRLERSRG
jgi:O-antigen/teichoic acid export membrane protein